MKTASLLAAWPLLLGAVVTTTARPRTPPAHFSGASRSSAKSQGSSLPHDLHSGMDVSADPYTQQARTKEKFGKANPLRVGILPVEVFLHNQTAQPIKINLDTIQLTVHLPSGQLQNLDWLPPEEVARLVAHPGGTPNPSRRRLPIGLGISGDKKAQKYADILRPLALDGDIVPPTATIHGFLFFNLSNNMTLVQTSSLYIPDASTLPGNKALIFFEVSFAASAQSEK